MVFGLSSASHKHTHFFHDLVLKMRAEASAQAKDSNTAKTKPDETDTTAEASSISDDGTEEMISALEARNRDVVSHEAAHMAAGGAYIEGAASYTYQTGPDGKQYAIGGQVSIDMSPVPGDPRATITKMMAIRAAAMSPADPSGQDASVAAAAAQIEAQAQAQLNQDKTANAAPEIRAAAGHYAQPTADAGSLVNAFA
jgi:hypothetical protein